MKYLLPLLTIFFLAACDSGTDNGSSSDGAIDNEDFETTETGLVYKFYNKNENSKKAQLEDIVSMRVEYKNEDGKSLFNSRVGSPTKMLRMPLQPPSYGGDINEGLAMMAEGDSAVFLVPADSFFTYNLRGQTPPDSVIRPGSKLRFEVQMVQIQSLEEAKAEQEQKSAAQREQEQAKIDKYIAENNITVQPTESGLYYIEEKAGSGNQAKAGDVVKVHYTGTFLDGTKFDSSVDRGEPIQFQLGMGSVIRGWDEGIAMMKEGGKATFIIPSIIGYGDRGSPGSIPPFTPLKFEVELVEIRKE